MDKDVSSRLVQLPWSTDSEVERFYQIWRYAQVGRCVNGVTHDINNYLGALIAYSELVGSDPGISEESRRMLGRMLEAGEKCAHLITALTNIARPDMLRITAVDLSTIVRDVLLARDYALRNARISLDVLVADYLPSIAGDAPKLQQALMHLTMNAQESLEGRPPPRSVKVHAGQDGDMLFLRVHDNGPGIPDADRDRIFEPFITGKQGAYAGYGLPAARAIARLHRGDLTYSSERGFILSIPVETGLPLPA